jgi:hypothetical protein
LLPQPGSGSGSDVDTEFSRQVGVLLAKGYPALTGLTAGELTRALEPLRRVATEAHPEGLFVLVVAEPLVRAADAVTRTALAGRTEPGFVDRNHGDDGLDVYRPLPELDVPAAPVYLLLDVQRGEEFCGVAPQDALPVILDRGRTPLTIHEGIALVTQLPAVLERNRCFTLAGSRRGDRRVPALWISKGAPKLGWCWAGNPHGWLGTASAGARLGPLPTTR